jgi:uncharacterized protein (TIGR01777 family)
MKIAVIGATGFIGSALCKELAEENNIIALTRNPNKPHTRFSNNIDFIKWNTQSLNGWQHCLEGADAIVNLAGENLGISRWNQQRKTEIINSRIDSIKILLSAVKSLTRKPGVIVLASAVGYYGSRGEEDLNEDSAAGIGFLANVCKQLESFANDFKNLGIRPVIIRSGLVLDSAGGALPKMIMPFKFHLGGYLGSGKQWISWITLADEISAIKFLIENEKLEGAFNLTSPQPIRNREFFQTVASVSNKSCRFRVPEYALKIAFGEMADEVLLASQKVYPKKLIAAGFKFQNPDLETALQSMNLIEKNY